MRTINVSQPNDHLGTVARDSFAIINENFAELEDKKVNKVAGEGLTPNKFTTAEQQKLAGIESGAQVNVIPNMAQNDPTAPDFIKNRLNFLSSVGYFDYNNTLATQALTANVPLKLNNNTLGALTRVDAPPYGVTTIWNATTNQFNFSQLSIDDSFDIRVDCDLTTNGANQNYSVYLAMGVGSPAPFTIGLRRDSEKSSGTFSMVANGGAYIGNFNAKNFPAELYVVSDGGGVVKVNGWYVRILRKNLNLITLAGGVDATALHKTGDESFTGVKTLTSTDALPSGFDIDNSGGGRGWVNRWQNIAGGLFNSWYNYSTGVFNEWQNTAGGNFNFWNNNSNGDFNIWANQSTGTFNDWYNYSTGIFTRITSFTASTGDLFQFFKNTVKTASINHLGHFTSNKFINPTGQGFLKANGDIDTATYKLDTPFFRHYGALLFDGITQTGHQDIPLGTGVDGKLEVTIFGLWQLFNISGSCSAIIDVFVNSGGSIGRNDLKHKDVSLNMASQYEIQGVVVVNGLPYLRIKKLTNLQNFISVAIKYQGTNYNGLYAPSNPLPFVAGTQNPSELQNVKLVLTNTTLTAKDWVNVNQILQVYINFATPSTLTLASGIETKGLVTQIINIGTAVATILGAGSGTITLNTNQGTTIISNGNNIKLH